MFYDNPVFGVGPGNYPWRVPEYEPRDRQRERGHGGKPAHSLYFTLLPELGMLGTVCFILMVVTPFKKFRRVFGKKNANKVVDANCLNDDLKQLQLNYKAVYGVLFGFLFSGIFLSVLYYPHFWLICALLTVLSKFVDTPVSE